MDPSVPPEPSLRRRSLAASALFHAAILAALVGLWGSAPPPEELPIQVMVVRDGPGAAGTAGGAAGGGAAPETTQAAAQADPAPPQETQAPQTPRPAEPAPPRRKPRLAKPRQSPARVAAAAPERADGRPGAGGGPAAGVGAGQGATGQGEGAVGGGPAGSPGDDYLERVRRWIQKFQHYPREASRRKQQGTALLDVALARDGTVLGVALARSSGFPLLDEAAIKAVFAASPVPPFPEAYRRKEGTMVLPAQYSLGFFERLF
jgi:periplasmic protein TonB